MTKIIEKTRLTCPFCKAESVLRMPADACVYFLPCEACGSMIEPEPGDCCVFCSYADTPCPPVQAGHSCGNGAGP